MNGSIDISNDISACMGDIRSYVNELGDCFAGRDNVGAEAAAAKINTAVANALTILEPIDYLSVS